MIHGRSTESFATVFTSRIEVWLSPLQLPTVAERRRLRLWGIPVYWHLLSLDAPTVAVLWAWSFARALADSRFGQRTHCTRHRDLAHLCGRPAPRCSRCAGHRGVARAPFLPRPSSPRILVASAGSGLMLLLVAHSTSCLAQRAARRHPCLRRLDALLRHRPSSALRVRRWFPREVAVGILFACAVRSRRGRRPGRLTRNSPCRCSSSPDSASSTAWPLKPGRTRRDLRIPEPLLHSPFLCGRYHCVFASRNPS